MKTATILGMIERARDNGKHVIVELRRGRAFRGYVKHVFARDDAIEIVWQMFGTDLISSDEISSIHAEKQ